MSKQGSEVAFIPDNISNISSAKEKYNQETSQKTEDYYISKLTKFQNPSIDSQNGLEIVDIKAPSPQKFELREDADPKEIVEVIEKKLALQKMGVEYVNPTTERQAQKKFNLHKYFKQPIEFTASQIQTKRYYLHQSDNTYYQGKLTETDVISEKESFVEEQHEISIDQNHKNSHQNVHFDNIVHYDSVQQTDKMSKKKHSNLLKDKDFTKDLKETFYVTQVDKYEQFDTQIGWLEHCVNGNVKYLIRQTNQLVDYNNAVMIQIQKVQLRTKIIELQILTNKFKIVLRKSPSSKHINFSLDLKFNRPTILKIPKKIDADMRKYCAQLQNAVKDLRNLYESNEKQLSLLDFYHKQFEKKMNYAYIYQEYLNQRAKKELMNNNIIDTANLKLKNSQKKFITKKTDDSQHFILSPNRKERVVLGNFSRKISSRQMKKCSQKQIDKNTTSLAKKLNTKENKLQGFNFAKNNIRTQDNHFQYSQYGFIKNHKSTQDFIRHKDSDHYAETLNKTSRNHKHDGSMTKRVSLTHHKDLSHPSNQRFVQLFNAQIDKSFLPLFNTPNRQKKHFYYECQMYLKQLQNDYLCQCESEKQNTLITNQNGFRQRELLKIKTHQLKNQILGTQVDVVTKQKQLHKENQILKKQLQLLENQLFTKYHAQYDLQSQKKIKKTVRSPIKLKNLIPDDFDILYKQAQRRLQTYKSSTMLQILRPNIPKSPKKISSQKSLQNMTSLQKITFVKNKIQYNNNTAQKVDVKTIKKSTNLIDRKMSKSPVIVKLKSSSRSKKFLNRFKKNFAQDSLNMTVKQNNAYANESKKENQQTTLGTQRPNGNNISTPQTDFVEEQLYAV